MIQTPQAWVRVSPARTTETLDASASQKTGSEAGLLVAMRSRDGRPPLRLVRALI